MESVVCPSETVQENCDEKTGVWTQTTIRHKHVGCKCKKEKIVKTGNCSEFFFILHAHAYPHKNKRIIISRLVVLITKLDSCIASVAQFLN